MGGGRRAIVATHIVRLTFPHKELPLSNDKIETTAFPFTTEGNRGRNKKYFTPALMPVPNNSVIRSNPTDKKQNERILKESEVINIFGVIERTNS